MQATGKSRIQNHENLDCVTKSRNKDGAKISKFTVVKSFVKSNLHIL